MCISFLMWIPDWKLGLKPVSNRWQSLRVMTVLGLVFTSGSQVTPSMSVSPPRPVPLGKFMTVLLKGGEKRIPVCRCARVPKWRLEKYFHHQWTWNVPYFYFLVLSEVSKAILSFFSLFLIGGWLLYNFVLVFAAQCESAVGISMSPPSWTSLPPPSSHPSRSSQGTRPSSLCYVANSH